MLQSRTSMMRLLALVVAAGVIFAACGGGGDGGDGGGGGAIDADATIIHGSSDPPTSFDPAGSYDLPSWTVIYNVNEGLLRIPPGGNTPEPWLAESCDWQGDTDYQCTLKSGVKFHDGSDFTSQDVVHTFERSIKINDPSGACSLLASLAECGKWTGDEIETPDDQTVIFHLNRKDNTWPFVLTTGAAYIVPDSYPMDELVGNGKIVGTGPYSMARYESGVQTVMERNDDWHGGEVGNARAIIQYFDKSSALALAMKNGELDIAYRNVTPTELEDLGNTDGIKIVEGAGTEIRYMVFNTKLEPADELAVRKAVAFLMPRQQIADNVYDGTVQPLYTMVPEGLEGHLPAFRDLYGETPDPEQAEQVLNDAGVNTPVDVQVWYTPSRYGDLSADEYAEIKRALEDSGLFSVTLKSAEWTQYSEAAFTDSYPAYQLGWFPDYTDADNYLAPFYGSETSFLNNGYKSQRIDELITQERTADSEQARIEAFEEIQQIAAEDAPVIPIWQGKQLAAAKENVQGIEDTFDPSFTFRYWLISKTE